MLVKVSKCLRNTLAGPLSYADRRVMVLWNSYDTASGQGDKKAPQDAESVLRTGRAVCLGFSNLFQALCR